MATRSERINQRRNRDLADWRTRGALTVNETGSVGGWSEGTVYSMITSGHLTAVRAGSRNLRVTVSSLKAFLGER